MIFDEFTKVFGMEKIPRTKEGPYASDAYLMVNGSSREGIENVMRVLSKPGTARIMLAEARAPFVDRNGRDKAIKQ